MREVARGLLEDNEVQRKALTQRPHHLELIEETALVKVLCVPRSQGQMETHERLSA